MKPMKHAVLADTVEAARAYAFTKGWHKDVLALTVPADVYLLYGHTGLTFDIVPNTSVQEWHAELQEHINYGRLVPVRRHQQIDVQ